MRRSRPLRLEQCRGDAPTKTATDNRFKGRSSLVFHLFAALAEFERSVIRERTRAGLDAARIRCRIGGRPRALSEKDRAIVVALLRDPSLTAKEIARRLDVARSTIYAHSLAGGPHSLAADIRRLLAANLIS
jgi:DNA invertase Pin-like site-specific DNA recombinase